MVVGIMDFEEPSIEIFGRPWREKLPPVCPQCGYDLRAQTQCRCPECGLSPTFRELTQSAQDTYYLSKELETANFKTRIGLYIGGIGIVLTLVMWLVKFGGLHVLVGLFTGLAALGCGLQIYRVKRLPPHARELLSCEPNYQMGLSVAALGVVLMILSFSLP